MCFYLYKIYQSLDVDLCKCHVQDIMLAFQGMALFMFDRLF